MSAGLADAIVSLRPGAQWVMRGATYAGLDWLDAVQTKPTQVEIEAEIARLDNAAADELIRLADYKNDSGQIDLLQRLKTATPAQIDTWLTNNVTNLAQARAVIAAIVKFIVAKQLFK